MNEQNKPTGPKGPMAGSMQGSQPHKRKSSLTRETLVKIGAHLQVPYNEIVGQGVPERFVTLIRRLETGEISAPQDDDGLRGENAASDDKGS
jgi:anti-sigma factor NepR-like protein